MCCTCLLTDCTTKQLLKRTSFVPETGQKDHYGDGEGDVLPMLLYYSNRFNSITASAKSELSLRVWDWCDSSKCKLTIIDSAKTCGCALWQCSLHCRYSQIRAAIRLGHWGYIWGIKLIRYIKIQPFIRLLAQYYNSKLKFNSLQPGHIYYALR